MRERLFGRSAAGEGRLADAIPGDDTSSLSDDVPRDRPTDDDFAPPSERDLHWAFRATAEPVSAGPASLDEFGADEYARQSALGESPGTLDAFDPGWPPEDGARPVTAGGGRPDAEPRDPAQSGTFDAEPWWGPTAPMQRSSPAPVRPPCAIPVNPPEMPASLSSADAMADSVFGDYYSRSAPTPTAPALAPTAVPSGSAASRRPVIQDPREWPPIPGSLLPPVPRTMVDVPAADPDGRRFA